MVGLYDLKGLFLQPKQFYDSIFTATKIPGSVLFSLGNQEPFPSHLWCLSELLLVMG